MDLTEELRKYKALLDEEIITQEEFDKKKKELLEVASKGTNKEILSFPKFKTPKTNIIKETSMETNAVSENKDEEGAEKIQIEPETANDSATGSTDSPVADNNQVVEFVSDSHKSQVQRKIPIIPIAIGLIAIVLLVVLVPKMSGGKLYKDGKFTASWEKVYSSFESSVHDNLGTNIVFTEDSSMGEHSYTFTTKNETCYFIIDTESDDDKAHMVTLATTNPYDDSEWDRSEIIDVLTTLFLAIDPSLKKSDVKSEITGRVEALRNEATGYGDKKATKLYEYKGISYILGYTYMYASDYDMYQLAIYEPDKEN